MKRSKFRFLVYFFNVMMVIVILLGVLSVYKNITYSPMVVVGSSMFPTLKNGDFGYAKKTNNAKNNIKRGQIILFHPSNDLDSIYIKRVIALPNDTFYLDSKTGDITVNGELFNQDFLDDGVKERTGINATKSMIDKDIKLAKDEYFVLGDNRGNSRDSAHGIGFAKKENILSVLDVVFATCDINGYVGDSSLNVCSYSKRKYKPINEWKYF